MFALNDYRGGKIYQARMTVANVGASCRNCLPSEVVMAHGAAIVADS